MTLSVCMFTNHPLTQVAEVLRPVHGIADEVILAIDARANLDGLHAVLPVTTSVMRAELDGSTVEPALSWLFAQCNEEWILRLDGDEAVSTALTEALPALLESDLLQIHLENRSLYPDAEQYIRQRPWWPDWHTRLMRNTPIALQAPGTIHTAVYRSDPSRYADLPIYHLERLLVSDEDREAKTSAYKELSPGLATPDGHALNDVYYYPENHGDLELADVPEQDIERIGAVLDPPHPGLVSPDINLPTVSSQVVKRHWSKRHVPESAYQAKLEILEPLPEIVRSGLMVQTTVRVENLGNETWPFGFGEPQIRLAHRWTDAAGKTIEASRTEFPHSVPPGGNTIIPLDMLTPSEPGRYQLDIDLVHENVRWFDRGIVAHVEVTAEAPSQS